MPPGLSEALMTFAVCAATWCGCLGLYWLLFDDDRPHFNEVGDD